jgi:hypothetical protein
MMRGIERVIGRRTVVYLLVMVMLACVRKAAPALTAPYIANAPNIVRFDLTRERSAHDAVLVLFGQPSLQQSVLPAGVDELRISSAQGFTYSETRILRLLRTPDGVSGELYLSWPLFEDHEQFRILEYTFAAFQKQYRGCERPRNGRGFAACRVQFRTEPNWADIGSQLDSLDAWRLLGSDQVRSALEQGGNFVTDRIGLRVERRTGATYQIGWYYSPQSYGGATGLQLRTFLRLLNETERWR